MPYPSPLLFPSNLLFPGTSSSSGSGGPLIEWGKADERYFHHGIDRGVAYVANQPPMPWNGIAGLDEAGGGTHTILYRDGQVILSDVEPGDFEGSLTVYQYPDGLSGHLGIPQVAPGLFADNQRPKPFNLSYRSLVGSGTSGDMFGYQIHLVYNAIATFGVKSRRTLTDTPDMMVFTLDLKCTPIRVGPLRPSAHYIIDTRFLQPNVVLQLESILYGSGEIVGAMPNPNQLYDLMAFGSAIIYTDHGDGTWTAEGSSSNIEEHPDGTWTIRNTNGFDNGDGTFVLNDTL